jgi:Undecaprenyl-phosphate galactose phosphotransferase WbaP
MPEQHGWWAPMSTPFEVCVRSVFRPMIGVALLMVVDALVLTACVLGSLILWLSLGRQDLSLEAYHGLWHLLPIFLVVFLALDMYRQVALGPAEELKRCFQALGLGFLCAAAISFLAKNSVDYSRAVFILAWTCSAIVLPFIRQKARSLLAHGGMWGYPVVIIGGGATGQWLVRVLRRAPGLGLHPVAILDDGLPIGAEVQGVKVLGGLDQAAAVAKATGIRHAIVAMPGAPSGRLRELEKANRSVYPHLLVVPNICGFVAAGVSGRDLGGILGLEVRRNLLLAGPRVIKRGSDIVLSLLLAVPIASLVLLLAIAIKLDSPGPVFFGHSRIGRGGRTFKAWKFRSMVANSQEVLQKLLAESPEARAEWEADHKLRNDPRVTRVGKFLRMTSLDELPQAWNVWWGEMSFIGPRPIVRDEIAKYGEVIEMYEQVRPGISGLWQISGRNDTTYDERVALDDYYVRNWSVWLDLHILIRTVKVVLFGKGAY